MKPMYLTAAAAAGGMTAWAAQAAINLSTICEPTKQVYDKCYQTALASLGGGADLFNFPSWLNGLMKSTRARETCILQSQNYDNCMDATPYIAAAVVCSTVAAFALYKATRR